MKKESILIFQDVVLDWIEWVEHMGHSKVRRDRETTLSWIPAESDAQKLYPQVKFMDWQHT
eukprot:8040241-Prorocentrum_lima.AAC.1